jgi:hypothetical protein
LLFATSPIWNIYMRCERIHHYYWCILFPICLVGLYFCVFYLEVNKPVLLNKIKCGVLEVHETLYKQATFIIH